MKPSASPNPAGPGHGPFHRPAFVLALHPPGKGLGRHGFDLAHPFLQIVGQAVREVEGRFGQGLVVDARGIAAPADFHAAEQVGLGARHPVEPRGLEHRLGAENLRVGHEADQGAVLFRRRAALGRTQRVSARERLPPLVPVAPDGDVEPLGQGVHHRHADPVQAAGGLVRLAGELTARVQHGHDDLERRLAGVFGVGVHGMPRPSSRTDSAPSASSADLDQLGVARHRLVHGVVEHLGEQVVQRPLVRAADIHAGAAAHGLQPLQHLDVLGGIAGCGGDRRCSAARGSALASATGRAGMGFSAASSNRAGSGRARLRLWPCDAESGNLERFGSSAGMAMRHGRAAGRASFLWMVRPCLVGTTSTEASGRRKTTPPGQADALGGDHPGGRGVDLRAGQVCCRPAKAPAAKLREAAAASCRPRSYPT